jgi:mannose-1-phosphate guanylyltransferase
MHRISSGSDNLDLSFVTFSDLRNLCVIALYTRQLCPLGSHLLMIARVRKALVLGAGLGTRLLPLTNVLPKPLLPIFGKPLITFALDHLRRIGIEKFWINTHHLPEKFSSMLPANEYHGADLELVFEQNLLETGGGMKNLEQRIGDEAFIVYSGDILTDLPVDRLVDEHFSRQHDVTLALRSTGLSNSISWRRESGRVTDFLGALGSGKRGEYDFAGISIWNSSVFARIPKATKISFVPIIVEWLKSGGRVGGLALEENRWFNISSRAEYLRVHRIIAYERWLPDYICDAFWPVQVERSAKISSKSRIDGGSYVGARCSVDADVFLENSILLPGSVISNGATLRSCIVGGVKVGGGTYQDTDFV